jgi:putative signal transducing protein
VSALTVAVVGSRTEAELIVGMLRNHGIKAAVSADDAGGWDPQLQTGSGVRVLVPASDAGRARQLIGEEEAPAGPLNRFQRLLVRLLGGRRS